MPDALIWPAVAVICIIVLSLAAFILFRPAFIRLIDRISKADKSGVSFDRPQEGGMTETSLPSFDELMKLPITASILDKKKNILSPISKRLILNPRRRK